MKPEFLRRFRSVWFIELLTLPGDILAGFFLVGGPSLETIRWWWFAYLGVVYAAIFLAGKLMASYREGRQANDDRRMRGFFGAVLHGLGVIAGASFIPASIRVEGVPFALHPTVVYLGALAVFLYAAGACVALSRGESGEGRDPGKVHALPFLAVIVGLAPAVLAWIPMDGTKPSAFMPLALFAFALAGLHAMMLWRVYPRYADRAGLETRHLRNLMRVQAALVIATVSKGDNAGVALAAGLGIYVLSSVFNYLRKPLEGGFPVQASEGDVGGESA